MDESNPDPGRLAEGPGAGVTGAGDPGEGAGTMDDGRVNPGPRIMDPGKDGPGARQRARWTSQTRTPALWTRSEGAGQMDVVNPERGKGQWCPRAGVREQGEWTSQARERLRWSGANGRVKPVYGRGVPGDWRAESARNGTGDCRMEDGRVVPVPVVPVPVETPPI